MDCKTLPLILSIVLLVGCTGVRTVRYSLTPGTNECQVTEVRPTVMSTLTTSVCWDASGRPIGLAGGGGKPAIAVPLEVLGAAVSLAGPIVGATILGNALVKASHASVDGSVRASVIVRPVTVIPPAP